MTTALLFALVTNPLKPDFGLVVGNVWTYVQTVGSDKTEFKETATRFVEVKPQVFALEIKAEYPKSYTGYRYV